MAMSQKSIFLLIIYTFTGVEVVLHMWFDNSADTSISQKNVVKFEGIKHIPETNQQRYRIYLLRWGTAVRIITHWQ